MPLIATQTELLQRLAQVPPAVASAVQRAAHQAQPAGEWSLRTLLIHLLAVDTEIWGARLRLMVQQPNPQWLWTEPDLAAWEKRFAALTEDELCAAFTRARSAIVDQLKALDAAGWERTGTHAVFGQLDVAGLCRRTLEHDAEHLTEMLRRAG